MVGNHTLPSQLITSCDSGLFHCMALWTNTVTDGWFMVLMFVAFLAVLFMGTITLYEKTRAFGFAGFTSITGSIFLGLMGLMNWWVVSMFIIIGCISAAVLIISEK